MEAWDERERGRWRPSAVLMVSSKSATRWRPATGRPLARDDRKEVGTSWATSSVYQRPRGPCRLATVSRSPKAAPRSAFFSACAMSAGARRPMARGAKALARIAPPLILTRATTRSRRQTSPDLGLEFGAASVPDPPPAKRPDALPRKKLTGIRLCSGSGALSLTRCVGSLRARQAPSPPGAGSEKGRAPVIRQSRACATRRRAPPRLDCRDRHRRRVRAPEPASTR